MATEGGKPIPMEHYSKAPVKAPVYVKTRKYERIADEVEADDLPDYVNRFERLETYSEVSDDGRQVIFHKCPVSKHWDEELGLLKVYHADECSVVTWSD